MTYYNTDYPSYNFEDDHSRENPTSFEYALCQTPITTTSRLIFQWSSNSETFLISSYRPELTNNLITFEDIEEVFSFLKHSPYYYKIGDTSIFIYAIIGITLLMGLLLFIFLFYFGKAIPLVGLLIFFYFILYLIIAYTIIIHMNKARFNLIDRQLDFNRILDTVNQSKYLAKGCYFRSGKYGAWVELVINDVEEDNNYQGVIEEREEMRGNGISEERGERVLDCYREIGDYGEEEDNFRGKRTQERPRSPFERNHKPSYRLEKSGVRNSRDNDDGYFSFADNDERDTRETPFQDYPENRRYI